MDRLTYRMDDGTVNWHGCIMQTEMAARLAAYEDTGLTPEEIAQLTKELQGAKANGMIQEHIISSGHNPADKDAIVRLTMNNAALTAENARLRAERDKAVELIAKLVLLCDQPKEWSDKVFRRHVNRPGDYMGCGYDFIDAFYRIWDDFTETADDDFYRAVRTKIEEQMAARGTEGKA